MILIVRFNQANPQIGSVLGSSSCFLIRLGDDVVKGSTN